MKSITVLARAKINLSLLITGLMPDGYHELDSVMCPVELHDVVKVSRRSDKLITCSGLRDIPDESNSAVKAARLLMEEFGTGGVDIEIIKNIPVSGGLGGSSADAAALMCAFGAIYHIDMDRIKFLSREIGSDVPFLLTVASGGMRARGRGEILTPEDIEPLDVVIAKPTTSVETKRAYQIYDQLDRKLSQGDNISLIRAIREGTNICPYLINDLYKPALFMNDDIEPLLKLMKKLNDGCAVMSGSGSSVVAICGSKEQAARVYDKLPESYYRIITRTCKAGVSRLEE